MVTSVTTEDLLKIIKDSTEKSSVATKKPNKYAPRKHRDETCLYYIRNCNLGEGLNRIPTFLIYYHYVQFTKRHRKRVSTKQKFFRTFGRFFELVRTKDQRYYLMNDCFDFSDEYIALAKRYDLEYEQKARNPKRKRAVSGIKSEL